MKFSRFGRLTHILHTFLYYRLFHILPEQYRPWYLKTLLVLLSWYPQVNKSQSDATNLRQAFESLGPVWIKLGQMLSTRKDLLNEDFSTELAKLQDQVPPFKSTKAISRICNELGVEQLSDVFSDFQDEPLATASIAQVHAAKINQNDEELDVVVKIIRPGIKKQIRADIKLMLLLAKVAERFLRDGRRLRPVEVIYEYEKTILSELNLSQEAANGLQLKRNFEDSDDLYIPQIYSQYSSKNLLVMERIYGIPVSDIESLKAQGSDLEKLAERGVRVFFTQVFRDSFFHADMHPGNIFISTENPHDPKYIGVDFGIIGTLNSEDKRYLAENFVAFFNRDYLKVAELHVQSGWVPAHVNVEQFEMAIRTVCEPIFNKPLAEISFGQVLVGLFDTARQFEMEVQPQLVLLQKTLLYVEGLGRQLYPQLDLWATAKPFLENWVNEQMGFKALYTSAKKNLPYWIEKAPMMPELIHSSLNSVAKLPELQQDLVSQYKIQQKHHQLFLTRLSLCITGFLSSVLIAVFANTEQPVWYAANLFTVAVTLVTGWKLNRSLSN